MDREKRVRALYTALTSILNLLEGEEENINATKIEGGCGLGVEWDSASDTWQIWEQP